MSKKKNNKNGRIFQRTNGQEVILGALVTPENLHISDTIVRSETIKLPVDFYEMVIDAKSMDGEAFSKKYEFPVNHTKTMQIVSKDKYSPDLYLDVFSYKDNDKIFVGADFYIDDKVQMIEATAFHAAVDTKNRKIHPFKQWYISTELGVCMVNLTVSIVPFVQTTK